MIDRSDLTICKDQTEPEIPFKLGVCDIHVVFDDPADRLISVAFSNVSTTDPAGFYQHTLGTDTAPACTFIPAFPTLVCDSFVTLGEECTVEGSSTDPDFDGTAFNSSGTVSGGWFNSSPPTGQGDPDANGRVMIARFSYKQNKTTTGDVCVYVTEGSGQITSFLLQPFDCALPGMQAGGPPPPPPPGTCVGDPDGGTHFCPDVELGGANEPAIAVNPTDPLNIAVAWNPDFTSPEVTQVGQLTVSNDGGETWSTPLDAPFPPGFCNTPGGAGCINGDASVAFDSSGRLFWAYLIRDFEAPQTDDIAVVEVDPHTGLLSGGAFQVINDISLVADKPWLAAGPLPTPGGNRLYLAWQNRFSGERSTAVSYADPDDLSAWSTPQDLSVPSGPDFPFPAHAAVGPTGIAYVAWHLQPNFTPSIGCPDGTGRVEVSRSTDGGANWEAVTIPYPGGDADITWNAPTNCPDTIPMTNFCAAGSTQPWIVPDPTDANRVYVFAADDPSPTHGDIDDSLVYIVRSGDAGVTWDDLDPADPIKEIEPNPQPDMFQVFPTAAIDPETGDLVVLWYDNRNGQEFEHPADSGNCLYYLDVFFSISTDQGENFSEPRQINDLAFDHVLGAAGLGGICPGAKHMGEYIGVALTTDTSSGTQHLYAAWTGNETTEDQQIIFGKALAPADACPWDLNDDGDVGAFDLASLLANWGLSPIGPPDFNCDGDVGPFDLATLLAVWGPCP